MLNNALIVPLTILVFAGLTGPPYMELCHAHALGDVPTYKHMHWARPDLRP